MFLVSSAALVRVDVALAHVELSAAVVLLALLCWAREPSTLFPCMLMVSLARSNATHMWSAIGCGLAFHAHGVTPRPVIAIVVGAVALLWPTVGALVACYCACLETAWRAPLLSDSFASHGERHMVACLLTALLVHVYRWPNADLSLAAVPVLGVLGLGIVLSLMGRRDASPARFIAAGCVAAASSFVFARWHAGHFLLEWAAARLVAHRDVALSSALVLCVGLGLIGAVTAFAAAKSRQPFGFVQRKLFHALIVAVFAQAIARHAARDWMAALTLATMATLFLLLGVELVRVFSGPNAVARWLNEWYGHWIDDRDSGMIATTHLQLLLGCAVPVYLAPTTSAVALAVCGVVVVGVGDSAAAAVGIALGRWRWTTRNRRTVEGTVAMALAMAGAFVALVPEPWDWFLLARVCTQTALMEALTHHTDNLLLPLFAFSLLQ